jgi:phosphatidylglycerol---prolipoprotein diacylglyceryl transferase
VAIGVPVGIIGARALDVMEYHERYTSFGTVIGRTGSSIFGAIILNVLVTVVYLRCNKVSVPQFLDAGAPAFALGEAMSRLGCFLTGCCYGMPWSGPLAVRFPPDSFAFRDQYARGLISASASHSLPVHAVQLYSAALALAAFMVLLRHLNRSHRAGTVFWTFIVFYGALRLLVAPFRTESLLSAQLFSGLFMLGGLLALLRGAGSTVKRHPHLTESNVA